MERSFGWKVKRELGEIKLERLCCRQAERAACALFSSDAKKKPVQYRISFDEVISKCCTEAFLRAAFLHAGSVINPERYYRLEINTHHFKLSEDLFRMVTEAGFAFKKTVRKSHYIIYIKDSEVIADFLTFIGAYQASMKLINIKIEKELRNDLNRAVNCESANLDRTINAGMRLLVDIKKIEDTIGLDKLSEDLQNVAYLRQRHSDVSIAELGRMLDPPLTKSGLSHRLKRISKIAEEL